MTQGIRIEGLDKLQTKLKKSSNMATRSMAQALFKEAELIMTEAKDNTPVAPDGGTLRSSGHVQIPKFSGTTLEIVLGFGGAASAYALAVHEHPSQHSPPSWSGGVTWNVGGPQFLKNAMDKAEAGMGGRIAKHLGRWP